MRRFPSPLRPMLAERLPARRRDRSVRIASPWRPASARPIARRDWGEGECMVRVGSGMPAHRAHRYPALRATETRHDRLAEALSATPRRPAVPRCACHPAHIPQPGTCRYWNVCTSTSLKKVPMYRAHPLSSRQCLPRRVPRSCERALGHRRPSGRCMQFGAARDGATSRVLPCVRPTDCGGGLRHSATAGRMRRRRAALAHAGRR
jgi:hypothetical protein